MNSLLKQIQADAAEFAAAQARKADEAKAAELAANSKPAVVPAKMPRKAPQSSPSSGSVVNTADPRLNEADLGTWQYDMEAMHGMPVQSAERQAKKKEFGGHYRDQVNALAARLHYDPKAEVPRDGLTVYFACLCIDLGRIEEGIAHFDTAIEFDLPAPDGWQNVPPRKKRFYELLAWLRDSVFEPRRKMHKFATGRLRQKNIPALVEAPPLMTSDELRLDLIYGVFLRDWTEIERTPREELLQYLFKVYLWILHEIEVAKAIGDWAAENNWNVGIGEDYATLCRYLST